MPRGTPRTTDAKNNPVVLSKTLETQDQEIGQSIDRRFEGEKLNAQVLAVASAHDLQNTEKLEMMKFMNEQVTIRIATSTDQNAEQVFEITINGKAEMFKRGDTKTVRRCYVDRLCMLKQTVYDCQLVDKTGERQYIYPQTTGLKYDFSVIRDDNPLGSSWLKHTLALRG
jgi:hypothetical protein